MLSYSKNLSRRRNRAGVSAARCRSPRKHRPFVFATDAGHNVAAARPVTDAHRTPTRRAAPDGGPVPVRVVRSRRLARLRSAPPGAAAKRRAVAVAVAWLSRDGPAMRTRTRRRPSSAMMSVARRGVPRRRSKSATRRVCRHPCRHGRWGLRPPRTPPPRAQMTECGVAGHAKCPTRWHRAGAQHNSNRPTPCDAVPQPRLLKGRARGRRHLCGGSRRSGAKPERFGGSAPEPPLLPLAVEISPLQYTGRPATISPVSAQSMRCVRVVSALPFF